MAYDPRLQVPTLTSHSNVDHRDRSRSPRPNRDSDRNHRRQRTPPSRPSDHTAANSRRRSRSPHQQKQDPPTGPRPNGFRSSTHTNYLSKQNDSKGSTGGASIQPLNGEDAMKIDPDEDPETRQMRLLMGFAGFRSTKNTKVKGNDVSGVYKEKKTEYRQYMNRVGGFNRPLSPER